MNEALHDIGLAIIADDDSPRLLPSIERAPILIACGDLHDGFILEAAKRCACTTILAVKGNHDGAGVFPEPILDLHLRTVTIGGMIFGGFGGAWRYKPRGNQLYEQEEVSEALSQFPAVDVFVAHNSPRGIHDRDDDVHTGFDAFRDYIDRTEPPALYTWAPALSWGNDERKHPCDRLLRLPAPRALSAIVVICYLCG